MKPQLTPRLLAFAALNWLTMAAQAAADSGWPRVFTKDARQLTVYQP